MMVGDTRQGWAILAAMTLVLVTLIFCLRYLRNKAVTLL